MRNLVRKMCNFIIKRNYHLLNFHDIEDAISSGCEGFIVAERDGLSEDDKKRLVRKYVTKNVRETIRYKRTSLPLNENTAKIESIALSEIDMNLRNLEFKILLMKKEGMSNKEIIDKMKFSRASLYRQIETEKGRL